MAEQSSTDYRGNLGRYALYGEIAAGGMATVHLARLLGPVGFARTVAIKRLHPHLAKDPDFAAMFLEEARLAARVRHPNVVTTLDVVADDGELFLVMEYVGGESLSRLVRKSREAGSTVPLRYVSGILCNALDGLHAAHEAKSEKGIPLGMVHRDISPQNIHVGVDGVARVLDFGIAKATNRVQETRTDQIKGKVAYMSPEQLAKGVIDRRADIYSASVVLWESLTGRRLFKADDVPALVYSIINDVVAPPSSVVRDLPPELDAIVMRGLDRDARNRWSSALEMAAALEKALPPAPPREIGAWVAKTAGEALEWRVDLVHRIESETSHSVPPPVDRDGEDGLASGVVPAESSDARLDYEDDRATLVHSSPEPTPSALDFATPYEHEPTLLRQHRRHSTVGMFAAGVAVVLLVGALVFFVVRVTDTPTETETAPPEAPPTREQAIVISPRPSPVGPAAPITVVPSTSSSARAPSPATTPRRPPPPRR